MSITQSIHRGRHTYGDKPALVFRDRTTTYAQVYDQVARCARIFADIDPGPEARVGILSLNCDRAILCFQAAIWAGMVPNYLNIRWSAFELSQSIDDFLPSILVVDDAFLELGEEMKQRCESVQSLLYIGEQSPAPNGLASYAEQLPITAPLEDRSGGWDDMAFLNYTGGTTGKSKGVIHSHGTHISAMNTTIADGFWTTGNCCLVTPLFHISGIAVSNVSLMQANTLFILPAFEPENFLAMVQEQKIAHCMLVPTMIKMLLDHPSFDNYDLSSLRHLRYGASPIDEGLMKELRRRLPAASLMQIYGQTEGVPATILPDVDHSEAGFASGRTRSAGIAATGVDIEIRDSEGTVLGAGDIGEVCLRASFLMKGYLNMPEQSAEVLQNGWLLTGDAGYLSDDCYLYIVDRLKDMIVTGAENVYSAEVENALYRHPAVSECAVVGLPHEKWGEVVHADVVLHARESASMEELIEHCREYLAGYKLPKTVEFVDAIPLTAVGKVDKVAIRGKYA
jgi:long-chain acyl-CoA synthetase